MPATANTLPWLATLVLLSAPTGVDGASGADPSTGPTASGPAPVLVAADATVRPAVERALRTLGPRVRTLSDDGALRTAFHAYYSFVAQNPERIHNPYLFFVDYGLDNRTPRGYVFDMRSLTIVEGPFTVAHGRRSSTHRNGVPTRFSNRLGSQMSALGLYVARETYAFRGTFRGRRYQSIGLRLDGVSGPFNDAARRRGIVSHGAPYVTARDAGRSHGCPAMEQPRAERLLPMIADGGLVFLYSPRDHKWLENDPWLSGSS